MENKDRKARVTEWENDGAFINVAFTQEDSQRVEGCFKLVGWAIAPAAVQKQVRMAHTGGQTID